MSLSGTIICDENLSGPAITFEEVLATFEGWQLGMIQPEPPDHDEADWDEKGPIPDLPK